MKYFKLFLLPLLLAACTATQPTYRERLTKAAETNHPIFSHQDDVCYGTDWDRLQLPLTGDESESCVKKLTGSFPQMMGFELGGVEQLWERNLDSVPFDLIRQEARRQVERGGIVTISFHPRNVLTLNDSWDPTPCLSLGLQPGTPQHDTLNVYLDRMAAFVASLTDSEGRPLPLVIRLWHECTGDWFWWGKASCTPDEYRTLWRMTHDRIEAAIEGGERLYVYSPDKLEAYEATELGALQEMIDWYPGDDIVDIIGTDFYHFGAEDGEENYLYRAHRQLTACTTLARERGKLVCIAETGNEGIPTDRWFTRVLLPLCHEYPIAYVHVWRNALTIPGHFYLPYPGHKNADDFVEFTKQL